jgi:branched-chain amino acid transport system ATP-binding protein
MPTLSPEHASRAHSILSVRNVTKTFGTLVALANLSFDVRRGETFGIAGPNGAGKSTLLNVCTGMLPLDAGEIFFDGVRVDGYSPHRLCHSGLARTFQIPQIFTSMSIHDNVAMGAMFGIGSQSPDGRAKKELVEDILDMTGLAPKRDVQASKIDLLTRKMTMLAAALATRPKLVFMDEPLAGLTSDEIAHMIELILRLKQKLDITIMLIEHKVRALSELSDRIMITHQGQCICLDAPEKVLRDELVVEVYLGSEFFA